MRVDEEISSFKKIKQCVRQRYVLTPDLFSLYIEMLMQNLKGYPGIRIGGQNLRYTVDNVLRKKKKRRTTLLRKKAETKGWN